VKSGKRSCLSWIVLSPRDVIYGAIVSIGNRELIDSRVAHNQGSVFVVNRNGGQDDAWMVVGGVLQPHPDCISSFVTRYGEDLAR
jgi:hypothetical protein